MRARGRLRAVVLAAAAAAAGCGDDTCPPFPAACKPGRVAISGERLDPASACLRPTPLFACVPGELAPPDGAPASCLVRLPCGEVVRAAAAEQLFESGDWRACNAEEAEALASTDLRCF